MLHFLSPAVGSVGREPCHERLLRKQEQHLWVIHNGCVCIWNKHTCTQMPAQRGCPFPGQSQQELSFTKDFDVSPPTRGLVNEQQLPKNFCVQECLNMLYLC